MGAPLDWDLLNLVWRTLAAGEIAEKIVDSSNTLVIALGGVPVGFLSANIPQFTWDTVRVSFSPYQVQRMLDAGLGDVVGEMRASRASSDELADRPDAYLMCTRSGVGITKLLNKVGPTNVELVWSMWSGYWDRGCPLRTWAERKGVNVRLLHSGGHAWPDDLARLVAAISAKKTVWVHTDNHP